MSTTPGLSAPPPPPPPPPSSRRGCCIAAVVVLVLAMAACTGGCALLMVNIGSFMSWGVTQQRAVIEPALAPEVSEETKDELFRELDAYADQLRDMRLSDMQQANMEKVMAPLQYMSGIMADHTVTAEEAEKLVEMCRTARGDAAKPAG
jgi:hypothetical protein